MEKISDFFAEIKNRITNPLLSSFAITWLIVNWKIPIGLISKAETLKSDGYNSYIDLIDKNISVSNMFNKPIIWALGYTFIFPLIRTLILAFNTKIKTISTNWNLEISKSGRISVQKYMILRNSYIEKQRLLDKVLSEDGDYLTKNSELTNNNNDLTARINKLSYDLEEQKMSISDIRAIEGVWKYIEDTNTENGIRILIRSNNISIINNEIDSVAWRISGFHHNKNSRTIVFCREAINNSSTWVFHSLQYKNSIIDELNGLQNNTVKIRYQKINN